jgi:paraquat-inducible protein B
MSSPRKSLSPTKSFSNILKSKMVSSPLSSSPVSSQEKEIMYLHEQLEDCRKRLYREPSKRLVSDIEESYERLVQICKDQRSYIDLLNDQVFELAGALTKKYDTTLQELERCGFIRNPKIKPPQLTIQESDAMNELDNLLQELQTSLALSNDSSKESSDNFSDLSSV